MVSIVSHTKKGSLSGCGGTIINDRYIVTAGHCFNDQPRNDQVTVILGAYKIKERWGIGGNFEGLKIESYKVNDAYGSPDNADLRNDIAIVKLKEPLHFTRGMTPICLPNFKSYDNLFAIGWGKTNDGNQLVDAHELREVEVDQVGYKKCRRTWQIEKEKQICAGSKGGVCSGDSGGPLSTRNNGHVYQVGIASYVGNACGTKGGIIPDVYSRITGHLEFIKENTKDGKWCKGPNVPSFAE